MVIRIQRRYEICPVLIKCTIKIIRQKNRNILKIEGNKTEPLLKNITTSKIHFHYSLEESRTAKSTHFKKHFYDLLYNVWVLGCIKGPCNFPSGTKKQITHFQANFCWKTTNIQYSLIISVFHLRLNTRTLQIWRRHRGLLKTLFGWAIEISI